MVARNSWACAQNTKLTLPMTNVIFPFSNLGHGVVKIESITFYVVLSVTAAGNNIALAQRRPGGQMSPGDTR
jgi:hypothetical protein